jgi:nicotinate-nucleotide pyrophosphorylase (carboxylating)
MWILMIEPTWSRYARLALDEDDARGDVTTSLLGDMADTDAVGLIRSEGRFVVAGLPMAKGVFDELGSALFDVGTAEGDWASAGDVLATVRASARVLLAGERVALNYLQRMCGIATAVRAAADAVAGTGAVITDTRKTTPGLRELEKYAVRVGGGVNHRYSLGDAVLWKDNHWALLAASGRGLREALQHVPPGIPVQVEVENEEQLQEALTAGVTQLLIDNQSPATVAAWARRAGKDVIIEASGGIGVDRAAQYARAGAHRISMGSLTQSAPAAQLGMAIELAAARA